MDTRDYSERFLRHLGSERRLAAHTLRSYRRDLDRLGALIKAQPLETLGINDMRRVVATLHARGYAGRSIARMLSAWRGFFDYLARDHGHTQNPCAGLRAPKSPKKLPEALTPDDARQLVELPGSDRYAVRDRAMLELLYSSGLRLAELTGMNWSDLDWTSGTLRVLGKGGKTRIVPVGTQALAALRAWRSERQTIAHADEAAAFVNRFGGRLSARAIQTRVKRAGIRQGIVGNVHPHVLRHSFASHVLQSSGDLRAVQEMLGHASISTTQVYTHLDFQHLAKVYDAAHPRARRRAK